MPIDPHLVGRATDFGTRVLPLMLFGTLFIGAISTGACGGGPTPVTPPPMPSAQPSTAWSSTSSTAPTSSTPAIASVPSLPPPAPPPTGSKKAEKKTEPTWASCHQSFKASNKEVSKDVEAMAKACASITKMKLVGKTLTGQQADQGAPQSFSLKAEAKKCYRVYAQAASGIQDLDVLIKDSAGDVAGEDSTDDSSPVVQEDGAVCFKEADNASVVVAVGMGSGAYALQIWSD
jgi:hypothetical protein